MTPAAWGTYPNPDHFEQFVRTPCELSHYRIETLSTGERVVHDDGHRAICPQCFEGERLPFRRCGCRACYLAAVRHAHHGPTVAPADRLAAAYGQAAGAVRTPDCDCDSCRLSGSPSGAAPAGGLVRVSTPYRDRLGRRRERVTWRMVERENAERLWYQRQPPPGVDAAWWGKAKERSEALWASSLARRFGPTLATWRALAEPTQASPHLYPGLGWYVLPAAEVAARDPEAARLRTRRDVAWRTANRNGAWTAIVAALMWAACDIASMRLYGQPAMRNDASSIPLLAVVATVPYAVRAWRLDRALRRRISTASPIVANVYGESRS
jgi:hypothetical protein